MNLAVQNPLMALVQYEGQDYYTSHYFHSIYKGNAGKKYKQLYNFNALIRSIESFDKYVEKGDIVELTWKSLKDKSDLKFESLKVAFVASGYQPLMLINATAQVALIHHLDDEVSKQASVSVNEQAAQRKPTTQFARRLAEASLAYDFYLDMGKRVTEGMHGVNPSLIIAHALMETERVSGLPMEGMRKLLPGVEPDKIGQLNATAVGAKIGMNARMTNQRLADLGLQTKNERGDWALTEDGAKMAEAVPYTSPTGHSGYQILWRDNAVQMLQVTEVTQ
jgi:hypothetical protein